MISITKNLKLYVENTGKKIIITFVLIDPKREIKEDIVFVMKVKTHLQNAYPKRNLYD